MNTECAFCGGATPQTGGKRPRKYCSNTCRQKDWQKRKKETTSPPPDHSKKKEPDGKLISYFIPVDQQGLSDFGEAFKAIASSVRKDNKAGIPKGREGRSSATVVDPPGFFMGHQIPGGLTGIDLTIWKNEIKNPTKKP